MNAKTGRIYWFRYGKYKKDPEPLVLVLWPGDRSDWHRAKAADMMHGINLNYLAPALTDDLVRMIAGIAAGRLSGSDTYRLYHDHMKRALHPVIRAAYRTYNPDFVYGLKEVSRGFGETTRLLDSLRRRLGALPQEKEREVERLVAKKIEAAKTARKMFMSDAKLTVDEAERRAKEYMAAIAAARRPERFDASLFTLMLGRRKQ